MTTAVAWRPPDLDVAAKRAPSLAELADIEQTARLEGYAAGHAEGMAQAQSEIRRQLAHLAGLIDAFSRPLAQLDAEVQAALSELAVRIAGALLGRSYQAEPEALAELIAHTVRAVGQLTRPAEIKLHPSDLAVIEPLLMREGIAIEARLLPDPGLGRGDVRVHTDTLRLDGSIAARLDSVLSALQGADRP